MFRKLFSPEEARQILKKSFSPKPVGVERVPLFEAHDRVLAEDITAPIDVPPFDRSTVDGYAVKAVDTFGADEDRPVALKFCGQVTIGEPPNIVVENGMTIEIATGAPLPKGADAVVMVECSIRRNDTIFIHRPVSKGENVMEAGSDIHKGETILRKGQRLASREVGVLAALGLTEVDVYKRPKIAVISTGAEVVEPGKPLPHGKIYDINAHTLSAAVLECGGEPINLGIVPDERDQLEAAVKKTLDLSDAVITSGGVSVGPKDIIPQVLNTLGKPGVIVSGIAIKPGKPTTIAKINGKPVFSLPGHPTSSLLMFHMIVRPVICKMAGRTEETSPMVKAVAATKMFPAMGRRTFVMVTLTRDKRGMLLASPVPTGLSGAITTLAKADGFVEIPEEKQFINEGEEVTVYLFQGRSLSSLF
ncbi:MAG: molybdopterin biosynthesis protein MoeA [Candidatus Bathyarchaeota archaeon BA2]|nr:MAG: molybdopterin biosynthesis protein MoeA [Candidatus Bathyarchaeota archaeon BA2]